MENGDQNAGGMYLVVLFIPCALAIFATLGLTELSKKLPSLKKLSYFTPLLLLIGLMFYPIENWRPILAFTIILSSSANFGLNQWSKKNKGA